MKKTEFAPLTLVQSLPALRLLKQNKSPLDVGPDKGAWIDNRSVDMALSREVNDCSRTVLAQQGPYEFRIADIALHKPVPGVSVDRG